MVHPTDMANPVGVAATEFTAGGRHFPTPHPPRKRQGGHAQSGVPSHAWRVGIFFITLGGEWYWVVPGSRSG